MGECEMVECLSKYDLRPGIRAGVLMTVLVLLLANAAADHGVFEVRRPTIVAFFPAPTQSEINADPDANEALSDFQLYAAQVRERLGNAGVDFHEVYTRSFRLRVSGKVTAFRPAHAK